MKYEKYAANLDKAEEFARDFISELDDPNKEAAAKTSYFMDQQGSLKNCLDMLAKMSTNLGTCQDKDTDDVIALAKKAQHITDMLKGAISSYKEKLMVDSSTTDKDTVKPLTADTIKEALDKNETTKNIVNDLNTGSSYPNCNYAVVADGETTVFQANSKQEINDCLMQVQQTAKDPSSIALYKVTYEPIPLKTKTVTILTV